MKMLKKQREPSLKTRNHCLTIISVQSEGAQQRNGAKKESSWMVGIGKCISRQTLLFIIADIEVAWTAFLTAAKNSHFVKKNLIYC